MKPPSHGRRRAAGAAVCAALMLALPPMARAAAHPLLSPHVPAEIAARHLQPTGYLADTNRLHLAIGLPLRDKAGLDKFLKQLYDPNSPGFRHYLSVDEFTRRFAASQADYDALRNFAVNNNLTVTAVHPNHILLSVDASVADIRRVFHVNIRTYKHPLEDRQFYAPDSEPTINLPVRVLHISGLDNYVIPHPLSQKVRTVKNRNNRLGGGTGNAPLSGSGPDASYYGYDFRNAYTPGVSLIGTGQNAALFEYDGYYTSDITSYEQFSGLPPVKLVNVPIDGGITGTPGGGVGEVSLDIEMIIAMAPGISAIYVYESPGGPPDDMLSRMATDDSSRQISASWVFGGDPTTSLIFQEFAAQGQSFYQASGDGDAYFGPIAPPEDNPYITLVGGTELVMNGNGASFASESVWNTGYAPPGGNPQRDGYWGSGGGISTVWAIPTWQQGVNMTLNHGSTTNRNTPDVAMTADNIWVDAGDQSQDGIYEGTSCAAPLWNGFTALVNEQAAIYALPPVGFVNPAVYAIGLSPDYLNCFHDTTMGDNTNSQSPSNFFAVAGYDLCTGWGTPTGSNLINTLEPPGKVPALLVLTNFISGGNGSGIISYDGCVNLTFIVTNEGQAVATGIQGYLYSTTLGAIVGQGTASFPDVAPGTAAASMMPFTLSTEPTFICGTPIDLTLILKYDQGTRTNVVALPSGIVGSPDTFGNPISYTPTPGDPNGILSPVTVSGLLAAEKITVSVYAQALYDDGLNMALISPDGVTNFLTFYDGLDGVNFGAGCSPAVETTFDDDATNSILSGTAPFIGPYQPTSPLSSFLPISGTNLNGVWRLNVIDEFPGDTATLECWSLNITPYVCQDGGGQCPGAELSLTMSASPNPALVFSNLVYTLTVSNAGPQAAAGVVISQSLPPGFGFVTTSNYPATATAVGTNLTISLGTLPVYATAAVCVVTIPTAPGQATSVASVASTEVNPNPNNTTASATTLVELPAADLAVSMSAAPASILQGGQTTFTVLVTNNGPFTATGVVLTNLISGNVNFISATTSQGSISGGGLLAALGTLPVGTNAEVTITVSPTTTGNITDTAAVGLSPLERDPVVANNTAGFTVVVGPSANLSVLASVTPSTVVAGGDCTYAATVVNNGPSDAHEVVFSQSIPGGTGLNASTFVSSSQPGVTVTNGSIIWDIGSLASGSSVAITNVLQTAVLQPGAKPTVLSSTFSVFGQPGSANTNNNVVTVQSVSEPPTIAIVPVSATLVSQSGSESNGAINPGETVEVQLYLQNQGNIATTNLVATLESSGGVTLPSGYQVYGALAPGAAPTAGAFTFTANSTNGGTVVATLSLQDGANSLGTVSFNFYMPVVQTFWNTNQIYIPALQYTPFPDEGPGSPYPSTIQVSNVTGYVSKVTVTVSNLYHTYPNDIGLLLAGPGANDVLMDAAANYSVAVSGETLTFDSTAPIVLASEGNLTSGTFAPASYNPKDVFTNGPPPPYTTNLANFNNLPANGTWSLYAHDDAEGDAGGISNGWAVTITSVFPVNPTNSLAATLVASTNQTVLGSSVAYLLSVTNHGATAVNAYLTNVLPAGLSFISASGAPGSYTQSGQTILYNLGSLNPGAGITISNLNMAVASGLQTNSIIAGVPFAAFNINNNSANTVTAVSLPVADLAAAISVAPNPAVVNGDVTYTLSVTNLGPSNAVATVGAFSLAGLQLVSVAPSQGSYSVNSNTVQCALGAILPGNIASVVVTAAPEYIGTLTNTWSVSTGSQETNAANNSATTLLTVTYAVPIIAADGAALLTQGLNPPNGAINSNETVTVAFTLTNMGAGATTNLTATLQATGGVTPVTTSQVYGVIPVDGAVTEPFTFVANGAPGAAVTATLTLVDVTNSLGNVTFSFLIPLTTNYASTGAIIIPQYGAGTPYPSSVLVSGLTNQQGGSLLVGNVTVTLNGFAHTFPHDVNVLLASPSGQELLFMGHAGGSYGVTNLTLSFSDAATQPLPASQLVSGTYLPTDYPPVFSFPDLPPTSGADVLALFKGTNPNGYWSLYVFDDTEGNAGIITGGWSLGLTALATVNPAARLAASMIHSPLSVFGGNFLTYQITVSNQGPDLAESVVITDSLPATVTFSSATASQGSATNMGDTVIFNLGSISNGATATATIRVITGTAGTIVNTATVSTASTDLYLAAATTENSTTVTVPSPSYLVATNLGSGILQLTLEGQEGQNYAIQTSSNLLVWTSVLTNTASPSTGSFIYTDTRTNAPLRFYRAIRLAQ